MKILNDKVNLAIKENEKESSDWALNTHAWELYWWISLFNITFFKDQTVPTPALSFENTDCRVMGHFVIGRNAFGLRNNININRKYLDFPYWVIISTLLHELCHVWEYTYVDEKKRTHNWYHKKAFRDKMLSFGILCNNKGQHVEYLPSGRFVSLLKQHAVEIQQPKGSQINYFEAISIDQQPETKPKGRSTLKKWECGCTVVRVGKKEFAAKCLKCGETFRLAN
jgi:hypothetical protein